MNNFFGGYQPQYQQPNTNNSVIVVPVQGEQGANIYPVAAGNTVFLFDFNQKKFWIKETNINGLPARFDAYDFKEVIKPVQGNDNLVSRSEFEKFKTEIIDNIKALVGGKDNVSTTAKQPNAIQATV